MLVTRALAGRHRPARTCTGCAPSRYPVLLESSGAPAPRRVAGTCCSRPTATSLRSTRDGVARAEDGRVRRRGFPRRARSRLARAQRVAPRTNPRWPFRGGWALFLGYELAAQIEPVLRPAARRSGACRWRWHCAVRPRCCATTPAVELRRIVAEARACGPGSTRIARRLRRRRSWRSRAAVAPPLAIDEDDAGALPRRRRSASSTTSRAGDVFQVEPVAWLARALRDAASIRRRCIAALRAAQSRAVRRPVRSATAGPS